MTSFLQNCPPQGANHKGKCDVLFTETESELNMQKSQSLNVLVEACALCNSSLHPVPYQRSNAGHVSVLYGLLLLVCHISEDVSFSFFWLPQGGSET